MRRFALPLVTAGAGALAIAAVPLARRARRVLPPKLADMAVSAGMAGAGWMMLAVAERVAPHRDEWNEPDEEAGTDLTYLLVALAPTALGANALAGALARPGAASRRDARWSWPHHWPLPARVALALLSTELIHYWHHRAAHRIDALWKAHAIHHSEKRLYWVNGTRFHPIDEVPLIALQALALRVLDVGPDELVVHNAFKLIHGLLQHANIDGNMGPAQRIFSTAEQHRMHHAPTVPREAVNYGAVLSVWDQLFGTAARPAAGSAVDRIGLLDQDEVPWRFGEQMLVPFRSQGSISNSA